MVRKLDTRPQTNKLLRVSQILWYVAHTRPRSEKKLLAFCQQEKLVATLPLFRCAHKYRGKTAIFEKPLFPGYVFLHIPPEHRQQLRQSDHIARVLEVTDQELFDHQLAEVMRALDTNLEIRLAPEIGEGMRVKIKHGPLRGVDGWVEKRYGVSTVLLRLDFIGQAAAITMEASDLEMI